jgi:hypothetical protein
MSGNVSEWNDLDGLAASGSSRGLRGGNWLSSQAIFLSSASDGASLDPSQEAGNWGFRLAAPVPEPSAYCMALAGLACGGYLARRRRERA